MPDRDLLQFHAQSLREYATLWFDPESRQESGVSEEEAAFHLCEHASMLFRYTGREVYLDGLTGQPPDQRRSLVRGLCRYLDGLSLIDTARRLLSEEVLDADQMTELEDLVIERDALEETLTMASRLAADLIRGGDGELRRELATARSSVAELDDVLWARPDALSVACRALGGLRSQLAIRPDQRGQWWFGRAATLDETFEQSTLPELLAAAEPPAQLARPGGVLPFSASLFGRAPSAVGLAAANDSSGPAPATLNALVPELAGLRVLVTRLGPDIYQFVFIDDGSGERSNALEGHRLVASLSGGASVSSSVASGVAMLRSAVPFEGCRLETVDGQSAGTLVLDTTNG